MGGGSGHRGRTGAAQGQHQGAVRGSRGQSEGPRLVCGGLPQGWAWERRQSRGWQGWECGDQNEP